MMPQHQQHVCKRPVRRQGGGTVWQVIIGVVVLMVMLMTLITVLKKQVAGARQTRCAENLLRIHRGLYMYRGDNNNSWPEQQIMTQAGLIRDRNVWIDLIGGNKYVGELSTFTCPADINAPKRDSQTDAFYRRSVTLGPSYGLNQLTWRDYDIAPSDSSGINRSPSRTEQTILLADLGPDLEMNELPRDESNRRGWLELHRDAGRLPASDDFRTGMVSPARSWLTARHRRSINLIAIGGSLVKLHNVEEMLKRLPESYYDDCATGDCTFCNVFKSPHYDFSASSLYWWTGPYREAGADATAGSAR